MKEREVRIYRAPTMDEARRRFERDRGAALTGGYSVADYEVSPNPDGVAITVTYEREAAAPCRLDAAALGPVLFGVVGLPVMLWAGFLWLEPWTRCGSTCWGAGLLHVMAIGLCFWYLAGLVWRGAIGFVGPSWGVVIGALLLCVAAVVLDTEVFAGTAVACGLAAIVGIVAYPIGLLARRVFVQRPPLLGLALGGLLLALGLVEVLSPTLPFGDYPTAPVMTILAPSLLFAGAGTLVVMLWSWLRGD